MGILIGGALAGIFYFAWTIVRALHYQWSLTRGVGELENESAARRNEQLERNAARLDNGCDHAFDKTLGGFPPNACSKCGLERVRPAGSCDHIWKQATEPVPCSYCQECGKRYVSPNLSM